MIRNKTDLDFHLKADKFALGKNKRRPSINDEVWKFQILLRKVEYYKNTQPSILKYVLLRFYKIRKHRLGIKLGFDIPPNVFGAGLRINHFGNIVVSRSAKIGMWCDIHQGVNIGTNNSPEGNVLVPTLGSNLWIGPGVKLFGDIEIGDGVAIGANSVVNKNVPSNVTIAGIPSKIIKQTGTESMKVAASIDRMNQFFHENPQFSGYLEASNE